MPCTAKKFEIRRTKEMFASGRQDVDVSLTTRELGRMIRQAGIEFARLPEEEADSPLGSYSGAGTIFGSTGGVMEAALRTAHFLVTGKEMESMEVDGLHSLEGVKETSVKVGDHEIRLAVAHGLRHVEEVLDRIRKAKVAGEEPPYHFVEVMACPGGCVGGGGQMWGVTDAVRRMRAAGLVDDDRKSAIRRSHLNPDVQKLYSEFMGEPLSDKSHKLFHTGYTPRKQYQR